MVCHGEGGGGGGLYAPDEARPVLSALLGEGNAGAQLVLGPPQVALVDVDLHLEGRQIQLGTFHLQPEQLAA